ncbi:CPBP family intramembrane metalloprotease [bacterium]|nr:CPBP family intramembrane metalloprotease [bacterium]
MNISTDKSITVWEALGMVVWAVLLILTLEIAVGNHLGKVKILLMETLIIVPALLFIIKRKGSIKNNFRLKSVNYKILLSSLFIGGGISVLIDELDRLIQIVLPYNLQIMQKITEFMKINSVSDLIILVLAVAVVAPITEEALFRGFLQQRLEAATDVTRGILLTSLVFGFIHFNPWAFVQIIIIGVFFGVAAQRSGSIAGTVVMHSFNNSLALLFANERPEQITWYLKGGHVRPVILICCLFITAAGFKYFYKFTNQKEVSGYEE